MTKLTVKDHTRIVKFLKDNPLPVLKQIKPRGSASRTQGAPKDTLKILNSIVTMRELDSATRSALKETIRVYPQIQKAQASVPRATKTKVNEIKKKIKGVTTVSQMLRILESEKKKLGKRDDGLDVGVDYAIRIVKDGAKSIYTSESGSSGEAARASGFWSGVGDVLGKDVEGSIAGGVGGAVVGGAAGGVGALPGAGVGAAAGAAGNSTAETAKKAWNWFWTD